MFWRKLSIVPDRILIPRTIPNCWLCRRSDNHEKDGSYDWGSVVDNCWLHSEASAEQHQRIHSTDTTQRMERRCSRHHTSKAERVRLRCRSIQSPKGTRQQQHRLRWWWRWWWCYYTGPFGRQL